MTYYLTAINYNLKTMLDVWVSTGVDQLIHHKSLVGAPGWLISITEGVMGIDRSIYMFSALQPHIMGSSENIEDLIEQASLLSL